MADKVEQAPVVEGNTAPNGTTESETLRAQIQTAQQRAAELERRAVTAETNYSHLRRDHGRLSTEVGQYRNLYGGLDDGSQEPKRPVQETMQPDPSDVKIDTIAFRQSVQDLDAREAADGKSIGEEMDALLQGERKGEFAAFKTTADGGLVLDVERTLRNAYKEVKLERYNRAEEATRAQKAALEAKGQQMRRSAMISGGESIEIAENLDVSKMTADEYLEKVLMPAGLVDPKDPPRSMRRRK